MSKNKLTGSTIIKPNVEGMVPLPAKITTIGSNDEYTLLDAFNIDWNGYKMGDEEFSYTGDVLSYIKTQLDSKATTSSFDDFTDSFTRNSQIILYNTTTSKKTYPTKIEDSITWNDNIFVNSIGDPDITYGWRYNIKDTESNPYVWMASMTYTETFRNNAWEIGNFHDMSSYILLSGESGVNGNFKSTVFVRTNDTPLAPKTGAVYDTGLPTNRSVYVQLNPDISIMGIQWSDGIPSGPEILWASTAIISAENPSAAQWTTPRQMTDTETYDVEFSPLTSEYGNPTDNPNNWYDPQDTLPEGTTWEDMIWRAERTCVNGEWTAWIIVKIKGERGYAGKPADYYEQRWCITETSDQISAPANDGETAPIIGEPHDTWKLTPQYESGKIAWLTSRKVIYYGNPGEYEAIYDGEWSTPMRMNGIDGVSNPIQPVLKYYWHTDYSTAPSCYTSEQNPNVNGETVWAESPGNPHDSYIYLWMIQGQRHNNEMMDLDNSSAVSYWTAPVCLSGKNGEPGEDTPSIEFIYKRFTNVHEFTDDNPASWYTSSSINKPTEEWTGSGNNNSFAYVNSYLGPVEQGWTDHPQGITNTYKYEYATYRKTRNINDESYWDVFNTPFAWSVYGENGLDGDGIEYIYRTTENNAKPSQIYTPTATEFNASQTQSEWGVDKTNWFDDPQGVNNTTQKYQWVSTRKYKTITDDNYTYLLSSNTPLPMWYAYVDTSDDNSLWAKSTRIMPEQTEPGKNPLNDKNGQQLKIGDKAWFPYSTPELWNWYVNDGTNADRIVMLYMRNSSINSSPDTPPNNQYTIAKYSYLGWAESPGNKTDYSNNDESSYTYLWMTSNYYSEKTISGNDTIYTLSDEWSTPVCLTGETGQEGEDAPGIEFIYFRTGDDNNAPSVPQTDSNYQQNDWPFVGEVNSDYYITSDGIKTLLNQDYNTWSDNPFGVTSTYDYEYASIRKKTNGTWGDFCKPFLWSKYGEDGVDGDGIEYIFYRSSDENEVTFGQENLPPAFDLDPSSFQKSEVLGNGWEDDPKGISEEYRWEYVSVRKFREITDSNLTYIPESYRNQVSLGDKIWFPYSEPKVWAHFAVDGLAINLVLESDNDMIAVSIDENDVVTASVASQATFRLDHNTRIVDTSYYSMYINNSNIQNEVIGFDSEYSYSYLKVNVNNNLKTFAKLQLVNNSAYVLSTTIPEGFDMTEIENELRITSYAEIIDNSFDNSGNVEIGTKRIFTNKVNGLHLSIDDIYQIQLDRNAIKNVIKTDPNGELETVTAYLKSMTSNSLITNTQDAVAQHLYLFYNNCLVKNSNNQGRYTYDSYTVPIGQELTLRNDPSIIEHEFSLYYDSDDVYINNIGGNNTQQDEKSSQRQMPHGSLLDHEVISRVFDGEKGNPGTDSKSQEYIYFRCDEFNKTFEGSENPSSWKTNQNYQTDDYPFIGTDGANVLENDWTDHPQGINETHKYEYISTRTYDTSTEIWGEFSVPVIWANWGHAGEDGDGVEYIYYLTNEENKVFDLIENPSTWTEDIDYQESEYIRNNTGWMDNPSGVSDENRYEYVSVRKYNKGNILNDNDNSNQEYKHRFPINYWSGSITPKNTTLMTPYHDPSKLYDYSYDKILGGNMGNGRFDASRIDINKAMHDFISILWNYVYDISINKPWGENVSYPINAYEMLLALTFYNYKFINEQEQSDLLNEGYNIESLLYIRNNYNVNADINNVLSNYFNKLINKGYLILCRTNNSGAHVNIFNEDSTLTFANKTYNIKGYNNYYVKKQWQPYSAPVLWSSYGTPGIPGAAGGSGLTIDFDNPSIQIAVNSTGYIKDNQTVTTYLNLYEGTQHVNNQYVTLSIDNGPDAFTHSYASSDKFGYTLHNSDNYTYYTWTINDIDGNDDGTIISEESSYYDILKLENNAQLSFNISYNGNNYTKNINLVPIQYGKDGADAETFELHCAYSTIHYNRMLDMPALEPSSVQYKIKHTSKNGVDFITPNSNNFTISYEFIYDNDNATSGKGESTGRTPSSSVTNNDGIINIPSNNLNTLTQINVQLKHNSNIWDEDILEVVYDGVNGVDGDGTEYIYYRSKEPVEWVAYVSGDNNNDNINPSYWTPNGENGSSDYIPASYKNILWFDHPQGVDSSYLWEYVSQRQYNGLKNTWERYTSPITWSHYGETGRDGDGVEYIYKRTDTPISGDGQLQNLSTENWHNYQTTAEFGTGSRFNWTDNPSGVNSTYIYEYVSVRKYKELTGTNKSELTTLGFGDKFLNSYIGKNIWFPYSQPKLWSKYGKDGQASAVTMDNDNENIAVIINNSNNVVRTVSDVTYFNMYDNLNEVQFSLTAPAGFTYSNSGAVSTYWSSENSYYVNFGFAANQNIPNGRITYSFTGNYVKNGTSYSRTSNVSVIGIKEADVPTLYQLRPTAKVIKWNGITDNSYVPNVIYSYVSYIENGENQIITRYDTNKFGNDGLKLYINDIQQSSISYNIIDTNISAFPLKIDLKYGSNNILLDSETITLVSDGKKGDDGDPGADAITLDFTNDQINLAVDGDGYIKPNQEKTTYLVIYPSNVEIDNVEVSCDTNKINVINSGNQFDSEDSYRINLTYSKDTNVAKYTININILSNINVHIPEDGLDIEFEITVNDDKVLWKKLKICGQHLAQDGQDGENAITYEIVPSANAIYYNGSSYNPSSLSYIINKYDGTQITTVNNMKAGWIKSNSTTENNSQSFNNFTGSTYVNLVLYNNDIVIDRETIPIINKGEKGEPGSQGFTGPIVRMRGEFKGKSNDSYYTDGSINSNYTESNGPRYIDIVAYSYNNEGTKYYQCQNCSTFIDNVNHDGYKNCGISINTGVIGCYNEYNNNIRLWPGGDSPYWQEATQFDFVATKLLYADQALIKQITSHDFIATKTDGTPVAGVTSGSKQYTNSDVTDDNYSGLHSSTFKKNLDTGGAGEDPSNVRIFAGKIWNDNNSYSLTYAPFNVRQDGTTYMTNAHVEGDITANSLSLGTGSFAYISSTNPQTVTLPGLEDEEKTKSFYILSDYTSNDYNYRIRCKNSDETMNVSVGDDKPVHSSGDYWYIYPKKNRFYQCISVGDTWNIIINELTPASSGDTIYNPKYYDVTADVTLIGYNYSNGGWYDMSTVDAPTPKIDYGDNYVTIDFYTYLSMDESLVELNDNNNYTAYADLGKLFGWFNN